jgi:hypothetical protein
MFQLIQTNMLKSLSALLLASTVSALATVTINFEVDSVYNSAGALTPSTSLGMLIADTTGDGFGQIFENSNISTGSFIGSNDLVIYRGDFNVGDAGDPPVPISGIWTAAIVATLADSFNSGDRLAFVWFPTLTINTTTATAASSYGLLTDSRWVTPADASNVTYQIITTPSQGIFTPGENALEIADAMARAMFTVGAIPEPSTFGLLAGAAGLAFASSRRKRRA